jgi:hypothetical protein
MNKKSFYNAIIAAGYIAILVSCMNWIGSMLRSIEDNVFMPMTMLTVLVLSVALMAYLFFYEPVLLLIEGKRPEAVKLFFGTVAVFAVFAIIFFIVAAFIVP